MFYNSIQHNRVSHLKIIKPELHILIIQQCIFNMRSPFKIMVLWNVTLCSFEDFVGLSKCWYQSTTLHGETFQNTVILITT